MTWGDLWAMTHGLAASREALHEAHQTHGLHNAPIPQRGTPRPRVPVATPREMAMTKAASQHVLHAIVEWLQSIAASRCWRDGTCSPRSPLGRPSRSLTEGNAGSAVRQPRAVRRARNGRHREYELRRWVRPADTLQPLQPGTTGRSDPHSTRSGGWWRRSNSGHALWLARLVR